jgi:hypothetical protein
LFSYLILWLIQFGFMHESDVEGCNLAKRNLGIILIYFLNSNIFLPFFFSIKSIFIGFYLS